MTATATAHLTIDVIRETLDDLLRRHATGRTTKLVLDRMTGHGLATVQDFAGYHVFPFAVTGGLVSFRGRQYRPTNY